MVSDETGAGNKITVKYYRLMDQDAIDELLTHHLAEQGIFIDPEGEDPDNNEYEWVESYCEICKNCQKNCPAEAIYDEKVISLEDIQGIGATKTCIDKEKCFPYFARSLGCSVCIKVCPFSGGQKTFPLQL